MVITLSNLPVHITQQHITDLLKGDKRIQTISFSETGNPDKVIAFIEMDIDHFEASFLSKRLNQTFFEDRRIQAYAPLFMSQ